MRLWTGRKKWLYISAFALMIAVAGWVVIPAAYGDQPHMQKALKHLQMARAELQRSSHDKGGHRVKALQLVDQAIYEVEAGIVFDRMR